MVSSTNIFITKRNDLKILFKIYYFIFFLLTACVLMSLIFSHNIYFKSLVEHTKDTQIKDYQVNKNDSLYAAKLTEQNKIIDDYKLDQIKKTKLVPNITVTNLPKDLKIIKSIKNRKELFIKITLPLIVKENEKLISLNQKIADIKERFSKISRDDALWLKNIQSQYDADTIDQLLIKVDVIPTSLALAQAVIESGWGTSRFAYEGNALFGQYIWGNSNDGIIPNERESNAQFKIKSFNSLKDSVASYMKNLNTNFHYNDFRINRYVMRSNNISLSGTILADYLSSYSIENDYPTKIKNIIKMNNFEDFENIRLDKQNVVFSDII